jgi:hypothetical protein
MFFDIIIQARFRQEEINKIRRRVREYPDRYGSLSHFVRCSVIHELKMLEGIKNVGRSKRK